MSAHDSSETFNNTFIICIRIDFDAAVNDIHWKAYVFIMSYINIKSYS